MKGARISATLVLLCWATHAVGLGVPRAGAEPLAVTNRAGSGSAAESLLTAAAEGASAAARRAPSSSPAAADTARGERAEYFLVFPSDTLSPPIEITIDDEGVRIDSTSAAPRAESVTYRWDEDEIAPAGTCGFCPGGDFDFDMGLGYQRVDGLSIQLSQELSHPDWRVPKIRLREIYSSKQEKWLYRVELDQRLLSALPLYAGASVYKLTDSNPLDKEIVGDTENDLAALFFKEDFRDYFTREGATLRARLDVPEGGSAKVEYLHDRYTSLPTRVTWSVFGGSSVFRPNPAVDEGEMRSIVASYAFDTVEGEGCTPNGVRLGVTVERAGGRLGGDFDFTTVVIDARNYLKLSPDQFLRYRLRIGSRTQGALPRQRLFYVGGIGTLRGHDYKELTGDQMVLWNVEYGAYAGRKAGIFVFMDSGKAWNGDRGFASQELELDAGVGIEFVCHKTQIYAAKDMKRSDSPVLVGFRLNRTF